MNFTAEQVFLIRFVWSCCLFLPLFYELDLIFSSIGELILCLQTPILAQSENNAADRQLSMIIVITNYKGCIQSVFIEPSMITAAVRDALESTLIIKAQLSLTNSYNLHCL